MVIIIIIFFHSFIGCSSCDIQYKFIIQLKKKKKKKGKEKEKRSKNPKGVGATGLTSHYIIAYVFTHVVRVCMYAM